MTALECFLGAWHPQLLARLDEHVGRLRWSAERIRAHQRDRVRALLAHAIERSPFHRGRLAGIDPAMFELADLPRIPVMTKADLMDRFDNVVTDRELTLEPVERALAATTTRPVPILDRYIALASGGSSGRRGVFVFDRDALTDFVCSLMRALVARIAALGMPRLAISIVGAASAVHATGAAPALTANDRLPFRFLPVPVTLPLAEMCARLDANDAPLLYGYPTMLARLADERRAGRLHTAPRMITSTSETLTPALRAAIADAFGAPIVDAFGSSEGLAGVTAPGDAVFAFNTDVCIVELVDANDRPVPDGATADKVLITNTSNLLQPLIRYELGDRFTRRPAASEHGFLRATVEGRADDVLRYPRADIHPHVLRSVLVGEPAVLDYQIRQTRTGVDIVAATRGTVDLAQLQRALARALAAAGLADPDVHVRATAALERDPVTGKVRRVVPLSP